jgi:Activator of Hsp90 ATPase homolog 1-like protein
MNSPAIETRSVVVERDIPHPPEKIWRALTQPHLIEEWLMKNDFKPVVGHRFNLCGDWGGVLDCEVLAVEPNRTLSYTWNFAHDDAAYNLKSVVTFTLSLPRQARGPACAWSSRASGRIRSRPMAAPRRGGSSSSRSWSRSWRGQIESVGTVQG